MSAADAASATPSPVRVKLCGLTSVADARAAVAAGADMIGLNFHRGSKRAVSPEVAKQIVAALPEHVWRVGIFVNADRAEIETLRGALGLNAIQLHGDEPPGAERGLGAATIRALRLRSPEDAARALEAYQPDYFLVEGDPGPAYGGAGAVFDWEWARAIPPERLIVAGGLTPENVGDAVRALRPFAVDVASGVERAPGVKDPARMAALVAHAKAA